MEVPEVSGTTVPALDPAVLDALRDALSDDELLVEIIQTFRSETPGQVQDLTLAQQAGDESSITTTAHRIKGSALTFGATKLVRLCAALESAPHEAGTLVPAVAQAFEVLLSALSSYVDDLAQA